jgi:hypothetical protein
MFRMKSPKLLVATAFALAALGATPLAEAGLGIPQGPSANAAATATLPPGPNAADVPPGPSVADMRKAGGDPGMRKAGGDPEMRKAGGVADIIAI